MINNVILVGRVVEEPELVETENGYKTARVVLAIQRPFKNIDNEYDTDFIPLQTWMGLAELVCEYVGKGSILGFKCRLSTHLVEIEEKKLRSIDVVGERVSFIKLVPRGKQSNNEDDNEYVDYIPDDLQEEVKEKLLQKELEEENTKKQKKSK